MLTKKQELFLKFIIKCFNETKDFPTIKILKEKSNYKSYNTIHKYLIQLEKKEFIKYDKTQKKVIYIKEFLENNETSFIPIINEKNFLKIHSSFLKIKKEYIAFKLHNNKLNSNCLKSGDILIIEKSLTNLNNKLVLVLIDKKYYVLKYTKKDGFIHLINDKESFILTSFQTIIGKVVSLIRETMD